MANVSSSNGLEKYPKLRFKGFSEPWNAIRFGDIVDEYSDRTKEEDEDILLSAAIEGMFLNSELFDHQRGASNKGYKKIDTGTLVLSTQNLHLGNANVNLRFEHGMVSPAYKTYHIHDCSIGLIAEWVKSEKAKRFFYDATTVGASVCRRNVEWDTLYDQPLYLPSEAEQERLAAFLTALSTRIKKQTKLVEHLKKYKRGVIERMITELTMTCDLRKISSFAKCIAGATPDTKNHEYWDNGTIPWLSSGEVNKKRITSTDKFITPLGYQKTSTKMLPIKTVIVALAGQGKTRGTVAITEKEVCTNQSLAGIIADNTVDSEYLFYYLETQYDNLRILSSGDGTRGGLNLQLINDYLIPTPSLDKQKFIAAFGTLIDKNISGNENLLINYSC